MEFANKHREQGGSQPDTIDCGTQSIRYAFSTHRRCRTLSLSPYMCVVSLCLSFKGLKKCCGTRMKGAVVVKGLRFVTVPSNSCNKISNVYPSRIVCKVEKLCKGMTSFGREHCTGVYSLAIFQKGITVHK